MKLDPNWVTGFTDGEGTFYIGINHNSTMSIGYQVLPEFRIVQHKRDIKLLYELKKFFQAGVVRINHDERYELRIRSLKHINEVVIPHFDKYPLMTQKKFDFIKFKRVIRLMNKNQHLNIEGIKEIIRIASQMNRGKKEKALKVLSSLK